MALAIRVFPAPVAACNMIRRTPRIGRSQDFQRRLPLVAYHEAHVVAQAVPENWISQITPSLILIPDGISLSHDAMPQTRMRVARTTNFLPSVPNSGRNSRQASAGSRLLD